MLRLPAPIGRAGVGAWQLPLAPRTAVTLMYHGVEASSVREDMDPDIFARHLDYIAETYEVVPWTHAADRREVGGKVQVVLTFDDGLANSAEVIAPQLRRYGLPALFFACSRHAEAGQALWFRYLHLLFKYYPDPFLEFRGRRLPMTPGAARANSAKELGDILLDLRPHPVAMYAAIDADLPPIEDFAGPAALEQARGMTSAQVSELGAEPLFSIGAHTVDHPYLTLCTPEESLRQMLDNKGWIEAATGRECAALAYPAGDYNARTLTEARQAGFRAGFAVRRRVGADLQFERERFGIARDAVEDLAVKVQWGTILRRVGLAID